MYGILRGIHQTNSCVPSRVAILANRYEGKQNNLKQNYWASRVLGAVGRESFFKSWSLWPCHVRNRKGACFLPDASASIAEFLQFLPNHNINVGDSPQSRQLGLSRAKKVTHTKIVIWERRANSVVPKTSKSRQKNPFPIRYYIKTTRPTFCNSLTRSSLETRGALAPPRIIADKKIVIYHKKKGLAPTTTKARADLAWTSLQPKKLSIPEFTPHNTL